MPFDQSTGDSSRGAALPRRNEQSQTIVATSSHGTSTGVHHEADQETAVRMHNVKMHLKKGSHLQMKEEFSNNKQKKNICMSWNHKSLRKVIMKFQSQCLYVGIST